MLVAGQLCRDFALAEQLAEQLARVPPFGPDDKGIVRVHPGHALAEQTQRRIIAAMRLLQINSASVNGRARDQAAKNQATRELAGLAAEDDDLFARPDRKG
ncbi:hypothetical protein SDC9_171808 [bioreactor metagenome]|uniref:Uncharacterized protein n=1 Tax=bioreactor metagenome TaxID=1076179 RepID=A0A645GE98_9ZZZZ